MTNKLEKIEKDLVKVILSKDRLALKLVAIITALQKVYSQGIKEGEKKGYEKGRAIFLGDNRGWSKINGKWVNQIIAIEKGVVKYYLNGKEVAPYDR